jgi:hypothetical protein
LVYFEYVPGRGTAGLVTLRGSGVNAAKILPTLLATIPDIDWLPRHVSTTALDERHHDSEDDSIKKNAEDKPINTSGNHSGFAFET